MSERAPGDPACTSLRWALALLDGLAAGGVERLVLSPGSRSTPLALAAQRRPGLALTPVLDERSAAFFALGLARASRRPVALACTSGSAPGHWLPAVIEAHSAGVPLVLLSADRPPLLRPWGANQTVDQTRLFGAFALESHDPGAPDDAPASLRAVRALGLRAAAVAGGRRRGPVHVNLPFPEPLVPAGDCDTPPAEVGPAFGDHPAPTSGADRLPLPPPGRGVIVCGPGDHDAATAEALWHCSRALALPVLADPLSGLRFGPGEPGRIARYDSLLRNARAAERLRPDWVLRLGAAPVSKTLNTWLRGIPAVLVDPAGLWRDPDHDAVARVGADPAAYCRWLAGRGAGTPDVGWLAAWSGAEERVDAMAADYLAEAPWCEAQALSVLLDRLPAAAALFSGNSLPIRQIDTWSGTRGRPLAVHGNRGASGIDGNLSTIAGMNDAGLPTLGLIGDLALVHDLSGLLLADRLRLPLVVVNNGGGRIFDYLPQHGLPGFEALWRTPVAPDLGRLAAAFGLPHRAAADAAGFSDALDKTLGTAHPGMIELVVDAATSQAVHTAFWQRIGTEPLFPT